MNPAERSDERDPGRPYGETIEALRRSTVAVTSRDARGGEGSGLIWDAGGGIVTNAHVARSPHPRVELWDGRRLPAEVIRWDGARDLAALRVDARDLPAAVFADSSALRPGEIALAVGNPLGFRGALATGVVHAVGPCAWADARIWVQADVRLAPGNSGGPLADARGRVIGLNTMIAGGLALAVPSNTVQSFLRHAAARPRLGLAVRPVRLRGPAPERRALLVTDVQDGSAAAAASLLPGDLLTEAGGRALRTPADLEEALDRAAAKLRLTFLRGDLNRSRAVTVALPAPAAQPASAALPEAA
jgi:serine protease Do